ncbi:HisA/HisF-related TIM barrel protein [Candidatus Vidania fulgoroideorum]
MIIIPALDIYKKKIIRLTKGKFNKKKIYKISLKKIIKYLKKNKYKLINIIDLEGAKKKKIINKKIIKKIIIKLKKNKIKCQIGGGIRRKKYVKYYISNGASKVIIGSKSLKKNFIKEIIKKYKKKIIISADIYKKKIMINSWKKKYKSYKIFYKKISKYFKGTYLITNIEIDGTKKGINFNFIKKIMKTFKRNKIMFSGGYSGSVDLINLKKKKLINKIYGYVVGKYFLDKLEKK